jgi:hypothetical protein
MSDSDAFAALERRSIKQSQSFNWLGGLSAPVETSKERVVSSASAGKKKGKGNHRAYRCNSTLFRLQRRLEALLSSMSVVSQLFFASASRGHVSGRRVARALSQAKPAHASQGGFRPIIMDHGGLSLTVQLTSAVLWRSIPPDRSYRRFKEEDNPSHSPLFCC